MSQDVEYTEEMRDGAEAVQKLRSREEYVAQREVAIRYDSLSQHGMLRQVE